MTWAAVGSFIINFFISTAVSMVLSWLFPTSIKGPRLKDLSATGQGYGSPIARVFGTVSVGGSVMWASPLIEKKKKSGGKGGGGTSVTTYTYSQHIAIAVCEGPARPLRIWAGGKLIWDSTTGKSEKKIIKYGDVVVYEGTADQGIDSLIESYEGVGETSAHRGTCFVLLKNLQLESWGNRAPPFQIEVSGGYSQTKGALISAGEVPANSQSSYFSKRGTWLTAWWGGGFARSLTIYETDFKTKTTSVLLETVVGFSASEFASEAGICYVEAANEIWVTQSNALYVVDADTLMPKYFNDGVFSNHRLWLFYHAGSNTVWLYDHNVGYGCDVYQGFRDATTGAPIYLDYASVPDYPYNVTKWESLDDYHCATYSTGSPHIKVWAVDYTGISLAASYTLEGLTDAKWDMENHCFVVAAGAGTTPSTQNQICFVDVPLNEYAMFGTKTYYDWANATQTYLDYPLSESVDADELLLNIAGDFFCTFGHQVGEPPYIYTFSLSGRAYSETFVPSGVINTFMGFDTEDGGGIWGREYASTPQEFHYIPVRSNYYGKTFQLDAAVAAICANAQLSASEYNVTNLAGHEGKGFVISRPMSGRDALEPLRAGFWFDGFESEGKIKFKMRGSAAVAQIPEDDLGAAEGGEPGTTPFVILRGTEEEIPRQVDIHYWRFGNEYEEGVAFDRVLNTTSTELVSLELPLVLEDHKAKDVASVSLYTRRLEQTSYQFSTTRKWTKLEPGDIVEVTYKGIIYRIRIVEKDEGGGVVKFKGVPDDQSYYTDIGIYSQSSGFYTADTGTVGGSYTHDEGSGPPTINGIANSYARFLDLPPLLPSHDDLCIYVSVTANKFLPTDVWPGAIAFTSLDGGVSFTEGTVFNAEAIVAQATTTLATFAGGSAIFDLTNTLSLEVAGELESTTYDGMIAGLNAMLVGSEIIQFQTATYLGMASNGINRLYRISKLLRGRRGTEQYISTHVADEICILLDTRVRMFVEPETRLGDTIYRVATSGQDVDDLTNQTVTNTGICLKPFSPVNIRGYKSALTSWDVLIDFDRRDRLARSFVDGSDIPMSEQAEAYDIEIYTSNFATLKRTIIDNATTYYVYDNADQITDFGSEPSSFGVKIYQKSAVVGRGFPGIAVVTPI